MSFHLPPDASSAELVRQRIAAADCRRRAGITSRALWRAAPAAAAAGIVLAALARWRAWSGLWPLGLLAVSGAALVIWSRIGRKPHAITDAAATRMDRAAGLDGELRSASWFASRDARDAWAEAHLARAAARLGAADWTSLYPIQPALTAKAVTAGLVLATLAVVLVVPGSRRARLAAPGASGSSHRAAGATAAGADALIPELQKQLEALLAEAEGDMPAAAGAPATAAELRSLLAALNALRDAGKLRDLARAMAPAAGSTPDAGPKEMKALADRAQRAAQSPAVAPEAREALEKVSDEMADAARAAQPPGQNASDASSSREAAKSDPAAGRKAGAVDEVAIQSVSEAEAGGGAGIVMMGSKDDAAGKSSPGLGLGGGSDPRTNGGHMAELQAALRQETVEANTDNPGDNIQTEARRKTEHGRATVSYAGTAVAGFDRGRASAPPPVPESRRAAVQTYFMRRP